MREAGVAGTRFDPPALRRPLVLDQFDGMPRPSEERDLHVRAGHARDSRDERRIARRPRDQLEAEAVAEKPDRAVEARHREAGVVGAYDAEAHFFIPISALLMAPHSGMAPLAKPGQSSEPIASFPFAIRTRTAPWLRS